MPADDCKLIREAVAGDQLALQKLLVAHAGALGRYADRRLPEWIREHVDAEDIMQQTYMEVFRSIARFRQTEASSFQSWLLQIADHVIKNAIKRQQCLKRGGQFRRIRQAQTQQTHAGADLVELLSTDSRTPSRAVMGKEAVDALTAAIENLPADYRQAIQLRMLQGKSLDETAEVMGRSPRAVQGLLDRARKQIREVLGRLSYYW